MCQDLENRRREARDSSQPQPHIDIPDLRRGGKCDHTVDISRSQGADRAYDHSADAQHEQDLQDRRLLQHLDPDRPVIDLEQKKDISLRDQSAQDGSRGGGGSPIGIRHPEIEREQACLNRDPDRHDSD